MAEDPRVLSDRDLLIEIHTNVKNLKDDVADHETRLRRVERILYIGIGFAAAVGAATGSAVAQLVRVAGV